MAKEAKRKLPPYVSVDKYGYKLKRYEGRVDGKIKWGKTVNLAPADAPMSAVWAAYEASVGDGRQTVGWLMGLFRDSEQFERLADKTKKDYRKAIENMLAVPVGGGVFGSIALDRVNRRAIRSYLDNYPSPVAANRHVAILKSAWNWGLERYELPENACQGVRPNPEKPRDRYVTDAEYQKVLALAPPKVAQYMEISYLLRARFSEVRNIATSDVMDDCVVLRRLKGSEGERTMLSERLRDAVSDVNGDPYICYRFTHSGFSSAWRRLMAKAEKEAGITRFNYHDLKAKGISDHQTNHSGHRSGAMRKVYIRTLQEVPATR